MNGTKYKITDVVIKSGSPRGILYFKLNGARYNLLFTKRRGLEKYDIISVVHKDGLCPFCVWENSDTNPYDFCNFLFYQKDELFKTLIKHPAIRLRWLLLHNPKTEEQ